MADEPSREVATTPKYLDQEVVLKADDFASIYPRWRSALGCLRRRQPLDAFRAAFGRDSISSGWRRFISCVTDRGIKCSLGVIGNRARDPTGRFFALMANLRDSGRFEFFNHGWDHEILEFKDVPYKRQLEHVRKTQAWIVSNTGIRMRGFGAPGNNFDFNTSRVVSDLDEMTYWFFGDGTSTKYEFARIAEIEEPAGIPNWDTFARSYIGERSLLVYQLHPAYWGPKSLGEFERAVDFLIQRRTRFVLPSEYLGI